MVTPSLSLRKHNDAVVPVMPVLHAGFILTGIVNTMLGPLLPSLVMQWRLSDTQAGYLFAAQFGASMVGVAGSSILAPRWGSRLTLILGLLAMGIGTGALTQGGWIVAILAALCFGSGLGLTIPTTNLLVSELNPDRRAAALNLVNFSWGLGAVACPLIIAMLQRANRSSLFVYLVLGFSLVLSAILSQLRADAGQARADESSRHSGAWRSPYVPVLAGIFFLYVGSEASIGGWIAAYARRTLASASSAWILTPSFFWAMLLVGRAAAPSVLRRVSEIRLAKIGVVLAALGIMGFLTARNMFVLGMCVALAGLGLSSVYPIAIAILSQKFGNMAARVGGLLFALAGLGGMVMPWLVGFISTRFASLRIGLLVPLMGCLSMLALYSILSLWAGEAGATSAIPTQSQP